MAPILRSHHELKFSNTDHKNQFQYEGCKVVWKFWIFWLKIDIILIVPENIEQTTFVFCIQVSAAAIMVHGQMCRCSCKELSQIRVCCDFDLVTIMV